MSCSIYFHFQIPVKGVGMNHSQPRVVTEPVVIDSSKDSPKDSSKDLLDENDPAFWSTEHDIDSVVDVAPIITANTNPATSLIRLYLMSYFPSGFWPRLITRLLADETFHSIALCLYELPDVLTACDSFTQTALASPEWKCWQSGVELKYLGATLLRLKEAPWENPKTLCNYRECSLLIRTDNETTWNPLNINSTSILELYIPNESITVQFDPNSESLVVQPNAQVVASLLTKIVDHVDTLLEDWYPDLGARFVQNSKGMYLITRIVPCSRCLLHQIQEQQKQLDNPEEAWNMVDVSHRDKAAKITEPIVIATTERTEIVAGSADDTDYPLPVNKDLMSESAPTGTGLVESLVAGGASMMENATKMLPSWPR